MPPLITITPLPPAAPAGVRTLTASVGRLVVGDLDCRVCVVCGVAVVEQVRVDAGWRRRGVAGRLVGWVLDAWPDLAWSATVVDDSAAARGFWARWPVVAAGRPAWCAHMLAADEVSG